MRKLIVGMFIFGLSYTTSYGQSSSTKNWNVYDCKQAPSACVDKTHSKEAYGTSVIFGGQTWSPSVILDKDLGIAVITIIITMPDNPSFLPQKFEYEITTIGTISTHILYKMMRASNCGHIPNSQCYYWQKQHDPAPQEAIVKFHQAFKELVKQDGAFAPFF